jgi:hypothetical protein
MNARKWVAAATTAAGIALAAEAGAVPVGLELMLLVDTSGSIDATEYQLQKTGYVQAFQSAAVQNAILANPTGGIAVTYIEWSGSAEQSVRVGWTLVDSAAAANAFAAAINATTRAFSGLTAVQSAMNAVHPLFGTETGAAANGFESPRQVIDVSGDGADNDSPALLLPSGGRDNALGVGVDAVNGIAILGEAGLAAYYQANVVGGAGSFYAEAASFTAFLMLHVARLNHAKGWVMQLHLGPFRDPNPLLAAQLGADAGCDTIGDARQGPGLVRFLGTLAAERALGRTILYNINPADNALFAALPGSFQDGAIPGKIQWGSGWWFMDQERGMREQMNMLSDLGLLSRFVGMVTDSRSFLSYPRHEYFRRILCDLLGADVATGRLPARQDWLDRLVADVCHGNAAAYFGVSAGQG